MTYPADTSSPVFPPLLSTQRDGVQTVIDARRLLTVDRTAWVWSRRVLMQVHVTGADAGGVLARARVLLSPIPTGWERTLRLTVHGERSTGTADVVATVGAASMAVELTTTAGSGTDTDDSPGAGVVDVLIEDEGASGTVDVLAVLYEDTGVPP